MEELGCGGATRLRHQRHPPSSDRFLGISHPQSSSSPAAAVELSEHDIFNTPSGSPSPTNSVSAPNPTRNGHNPNHHGILAALNGTVMTRSGSDTRTVFNHKASSSPAASASQRMAIPRPPPALERLMRPQQHHSLPVNVPMVAASVPPRAGNADDDVVFEEGIEGEGNGGRIMPPHEVVAARDSAVVAYSVVEGAGRTLKGRDLRQVRNAIWRSTGFLD